MIRCVGVMSLALLYLTACTGDFLPVNQSTGCRTPGWSRTVDGLPSPAYPARGQTGEEFVLLGVIRDAVTCEPIPDATVMFDMTNAAGEYDGTQRGTIQTSPLGLFVIQSNRPGAYGGGVPHIHLFIDAPTYTPITAAYDFDDRDASIDWMVIGLSVE